MPDRRMCWSSWHQSPNRNDWPPVSNEVGQPYPTGCVRILLVWPWLVVGSPHNLRSYQKCCAVHRLRENAQSGCRQCPHPKRGRRPRRLKLFLKYQQWQCRAGQVFRLNYRSRGLDLLFDLRCPSQQCYFQSLCRPWFNLLSA